MTCAMTAFGDETVTMSAPSATRDLFNAFMGIRPRGFGLLFVRGRKLLEKYILVIAEQQIFMEQNPAQHAGAADKAARNRM